jgi:hypothetical protein
MTRSSGCDDLFSVIPETLKEEFEEEVAGRLTHVVTSLLGRVKGEMDEDTKQVSLGNPTRSGIEVRWRLEQLIRACLEEERRRDPKLATPDGRLASSSEYNATTIFSLSTVDVVDQVNVLLDQEESPHYQLRDYLHLHISCSNDGSSSSQRVSAKSRSKVAGWLAEIADHFSLKRQIVAVAMSYIDRFLSLHIQAASAARCSHTKYQLVALTCLSIATKNLEVSHLDIETLVLICQGYYCADEILEMEFIVLHALNWRLCSPTTLPIAYRVLAILTKIVSRVANGAKQKQLSRTLNSCLVKFTRLQLELAVADYSSSVLRKPSTVALASILNTMDLLGFNSKEKRAFSRELADMTGLDTDSMDIAEARLELIEIFDKHSENASSRDYDKRKR